LLGLRWLLTEHEITDAKYILALDGPVRLYRNPDALPSQFLVSCVRYPNNLWAEMNDLDAKSWALVEDSVQIVPLCGQDDPPSDQGGLGWITVDSSTPLTVQLTVRANQPVMWVQTDTHYPGWLASLNGDPVELLRVNGAFRGVEIPTGEHTLRLRYRPAEICKAIIIAPFSLLGLLVWGWRRHKR